MHDILILGTFVTEIIIITVIVFMQMVVGNNQATTARFSYRFYEPKPTSPPTTQPPTTRPPTTNPSNTTQPIGTLPPTTRPPTTNLPNATQPPTTQPTGTRPTSTVTRTFSATNQRFGEEKDRSLSCSVCPDECSLTLYGSVLHMYSVLTCIELLLTSSLAISCAYRLPFRCYHPCGSTQHSDQGGSSQCWQLPWYVCACSIPEGTPHHQV